jgi:hypothetical protein
MKPLAFLLLFSVAAAASAAAQEVTATAPKPPDSPLVKAAKASGGPKRKPKRKVITNADVKKSTGRVVTLPGKPAPAGTSSSTTAAKPLKGPIERRDEQLRAQKAAADLVNSAQKKVSELEKDLRLLEDAYYAENDPTYRDTTITSRFNETRRQLDQARKTLADARDAQEKVGDKPSS